MSIQIVNAKEKNIHKMRMVEFLTEIDKDFVPPLSSRVSIADYAQKVLDNGVVLIALQDNEIVGLLGFYCNDIEEFIGYWTMIGVAREKRKTGISQTLINEMIKYAQQSGMKKIRGEAPSSNSAVLSMLNKNGFVELEFGEATIDGSRYVCVERDIEIQQTA